MNIQETLKSFFVPSAQIYKLRRIWLTNKVKTANKGFTHCIEEGDQVFIYEGKLCNCLDKPSHIITSCDGTIGDSLLQITVAEIGTNELSIVKIQ